MDLAPQYVCDLLTEHLHDTGQITMSYLALVLTYTRRVLHSRVNGLELSACEDENVQVVRGFKIDLHKFLFNN